MPADQPVRQERPALPSALLLDMDGTIVDSEPYWIAEEFALVEAHGGRWSEAQAHALVGNPLVTSAEIIRETGPVDLPVEEIVERLMGGVIRRFVEQVPWRPGAQALIADAARLGIPCALVTMSYTAFAQELVDRLPQGTFAALVTGDVVTHGKPHPEPYLTACRLLGVEPGSALAVEDSPTGARSAVAAGVPTIAVPLVVPVGAEVGATVVDSLEGESVESLWVAAGRA